METQSANLVELPSFQGASMSEIRKQVDDYLKKFQEERSEAKEFFVRIFPVAACYELD